MQQGVQYHPTNRRNIFSNFAPNRCSRVTVQPCSVAETVLVVEEAGGEVTEEFEL